MVRVDEDPKSCSVACSRGDVEGVELVENEAEATALEDVTRDLGDSGEILECRLEAAWVDEAVLGYKGRVEDAIVFLFDRRLSVDPNRRSFFKLFGDWLEDAISIRALVAVERSASVAALGRDILVETGAEFKSHDPDSLACF